MAAVGMAVGASATKGARTAWRTGWSTTTAAARSTATSTRPISIGPAGERVRSVVTPGAVMEVAVAVGGRGMLGEESRSGWAGADGNARAAGGVMVAMPGRVNEGRVSRLERGTGVWPLPGVGR